MSAKRFVIIATLGLALLPNLGLAESATVAVASNFASTAEILAAEYGKESGNQIAVASGATGKLYAQISAGAPFDALLSADRDSVEKLVTDGAAIPETRFSYAVGHLALWSADPNLDLSDPKAALQKARHIAIANPDIAPYGKAAVETIEKLGLGSELGAHIVTGENIGQVQSMIASGAADMGFVSAAALAGKANASLWLVPEHFHQPIVQDAVVLTHGKDNVAAEGFLNFLKTDGAKSMIAAAGYGVLP